MDNRKIADLLFPNLKWTTEEIEAPSEIEVVLPSKEETEIEE